MSDIFLSYASQDRERVRPLVEALGAAGWSVFWDRRIPVGQTWAKVLEMELNAASALVVAWSKHAVQSAWVIEEVLEARRLKLPIFPIMIDGVLPPLGFRSMHAADFSDWDGTSASSLLQSLIQDIKTVLGLPDAPASESEPAAAQFAEKTKPSPPQTITNRVGMTLMLIPAGEFQMGSGLSPEEVAERYGGKAEWFTDEHPQHLVTISRPFYLQTTPVTQGQWRQVMGNNPARFQGGGDDCPVDEVSWEEAQEFIGKLNQLEQTDAYRLPTEAEWEYACRAGGTGEFYFGDDVAALEHYAWYANNSQGTTHPVGKLKPNAWGLHDMHGNVWEWCRDWGGPYAAGPVVDPQGPDTGPGRVLRGGSWYDSARLLRSAERNFSNPGFRYFFIGFRVARTVF